MERLFYEVIFVYSNVGVNLNKELTYLSKRKRIPRSKHANTNYCCEESLLETLENKYSNDMANIVDFIKDKAKTFKSSFSNSNNNAKNTQSHIECCSSKSKMDMKNMALMGIGALAVVYGIKALARHR